MALLSPAEAAIQTGYSVELLEKLTSYAPKHGEQRKLEVKRLADEVWFDDADVMDFIRYLKAPWPVPEGGTRPTIPAYIQEDVRAECHQQCAICGSMDNGELAHIEPVADSYSNSPDNLILLCPNHHTEYDYGFQPSTNVTFEVVTSAKTMKRSSRIRMLRFESNAVTALRAALGALSVAEAKAGESDDELLRTTLTTEIAALLDGLPALLQAAEQAGSADRDLTDAWQRVTAMAPELSKTTLSAVNRRRESEGDVRTAAQEVLQVGSPVVVLDEVACPRCGGRGQTGLVGDLCAYCEGRCYLPQADVDAYDPARVDEVDCPHCGGRGQTGKVGELCTYCHGSRYVSHAEAEAYDRSAIDEVDCPRCYGSGQTGKVGDVCTYCGGSCVVAQTEAESYEPDDLDETDCPHCGGNGQFGLNGEACGFCGGSCYVSRTMAEAYDPDELNEVRCPRCGGSGQQGFAYFCPLCDGRTVVTREVDGAYEGERAELDNW